MAILYSRTAVYETWVEENSSKDNIDYVFDSMKNEVKKILFNKGG